MTKPEVILYVLSTSAGMVGRLINSKEYTDIDAATGDVIAEILNTAKDYWEILDIWDLFAKWERH